MERRGILLLYGRHGFSGTSPIKLAEVKATLRDERGMNDSAIEAMLYYDVDFFRVRVPRIVLPSSKLY